MVAILKPNRSLKDTFYYNENKLKAGEAKCLLAENYPREAAALSEVDKLAMLQKMAAIRPGVKVNSLHISLNFDPSEVLSEDLLRDIARDYMDQIGFGNQPYLVYQHFDAAHPHVHLVTTNIQPDGGRISLHHLGIKASEPARKLIEEKYKLVPAEDQGKTDYTLRPVMMERAIYGRTQTKRAIGNVLLGVLDTYRFSSLAELNAVLSLYHVRAERGSENSRIYKHRGLVYRLLDEKGIVVGVPIKASAYFQKPGLDYLEQRFRSNAPVKKPFQIRVKNAVDLGLLKQKSNTIDHFKTALRKQGIDVVLRQNGDGLIYGVTYVDHQTKCVINGSELGKNYSAKGILERLLPAHLSAPDMDIARMAPTPSIEKRVAYTVNSSAPFSGSPDSFDPQPAKHKEGIIELLIQPENTWEPNPYDLTRRRKKRKRRVFVKGG